MFLLPPRKLFLSLHSNSSIVNFVNSKDFLLSKPFADPAARAPVHLLRWCSYSSQTLGFPSSSCNNCASTKHFSSLNHRIVSGYGCSPYSSMPKPRPINGVVVGTMEQFLDELKLARLRQKLQEMGIDGKYCTPGQHAHLICPTCKGGDSREKSFNLTIEKDGAAMWICHRAKCGWKGSTGAFADSKSTYASKKEIPKIKQPHRVLDERSLKLEPIGREISLYFHERLISEETLRRNGVMQQKNGNKISIAFTYRRNGELVSCKYRDAQKQFWQEANTEKIFYGMDDIMGASDIIIVEGEIDKLSMEEAGFKNCVSVPDGAPPKVSLKGTKYKYLWNFKDYTDKASRIILATDGDRPGQALAEVLARRLGRERCWRVKWPKKNDTESCKDANEVLMFLGAEELRRVIENAELLPRKGLYNFKDYFHEIDDYYYQRLGPESGVSSGCGAPDDLCNVSTMADER